MLVGILTTLSIIFLIFALQRKNAVLDQPVTINKPLAIFNIFLCLLCEVTPRLTLGILTTSHYITELNWQYVYFPDC